MAWGGTAAPVQGQQEPDSIQVRPSPEAAPPGSLRHRPDSVGLRPGGARQGAPRVRQETNPGDAEVDTIRLRSESSQSNGEARPRQQPARDAEPRANQPPPSDERDRRPIPDENETVQEDPPTQRRSAGGVEGIWAMPSSEVDTGQGRPQIRLQPSQFPTAVRDTISTLSVSNADLRSLLRGIGEEYGVNLLVDDGIQESVTIRLSQISVLDALQLICREHNLSLVQSGPVFRVRQPPDPPPEPPNVEYSDGRVTLDLSDDDVETVAEVLTKNSPTNVIVSQSVDGTLDGYLQDVPLESGLSTLLDNNGYTLRCREDILVIDRKVQRPSDGQGGRRRRSLWVDADEGQVDLEVRQAPVGDVLEEVAAQVDLNLVTYESPNGRISAKVQDASVEEVFDLLFRASDMTYRRNDSTYFVGTRDMSSIATTELVSLDHVKADRVPEMLPPTLKQKATINVVSEHNGLMLTGANEAIDELRSAIEALDRPTPLILIEALVVDFTTTDLFELGLEFGQDQERSEQAREQGYRFGDDGFELDGEDERTNEYLQELIPLTSNFGVQTIGELPDDFFFKLQALSQEGKVDIRSRPQVAALSGHTASIEIGQTQYFILRKETPVRSPEGGAIIQETERFEQIEANVSLEITPWVTSSGEVTTEIRPEFSQPIGEFSAEVPPTINTRVLESTVRLKEGETIILGGLIRDEENVQYNKIPILGSIPLLGRLFRSRSSNTEKSELVIYLTPHVFYGSEAEGDRWEQLREEMNLREPRWDRD